MAEKHLGVDLGRVDATQKAELGFEVGKSDGRRYRYSQASGSIALGDVLMADYAAGGLLWSVKTTSGADVPAIGCWPNENPPAGTARVAITTGQFFWMLVKGDANVKAAATVVVGAPAIPIATAGTVDDTAATAANALAQAAGVPMVFMTLTTSGFARVMFG